MAQQIKKKFIGDKQVDGSKILLEDVKSVKVKDSTSTEIDLIKLNVADQVVIPNDVILEGDLTVQGAITSIESATLQVTDANVVVNKDGNLASADSAGAGITVEMSDATDAAVSFDSSLASKFKIGEVGAQHQIVSTAHSQTLTNKTIDADSNTISNLEVDNLKAGVLDIDLSSVSTSDDTIPSAKAVKSYVDSEVSAAQGAVDAVEDDVSHLVTLSGVAVDSDNLGVFTGAILDDNAETVKSAIQKLSDQIESIGGGGSSTQLELDATQLGAGLEADGSWVPPVGSTIISSSDSIKEALQVLDVEAQNVVDNAVFKNVPASINTTHTYQTGGITLGEDSNGISASDRSIPGGNFDQFMGLGSTELFLDDYAADGLTSVKAGFISLTESNITSNPKLPTAPEHVVVKAYVDTADSLKVSKAGDTMTGTLIINPSSGNAAELLDLNIGVPSWGPAYLAVALKDGSTKQLYVGSADQLGAFAGTASKKVLLASGFSSGAASGLVQVASGDAQVSGNSGNVEIFSGIAAGGISGAAKLLSGPAGSSSGAAVVASGAAQNTGAVQIQSGNASAGNSGNIFIYTGTATGTKGSILINTQMNFQSAGRIINLQDAVSAQDAVTKAQLDAHINDASGAHAASAISVSPVGNLAADDVQEALLELQVDIDSLNALQDDYVVLDGSRPMTGNLNMMPSLGVHNKVVGLGDPTDPRDAVNKQYVDAIAEGLHVHAPAKLLASADLGGTYDNGVSGVGAFLDLSASPVVSIDGVSSFSEGDRIIVTFQNGSNLDPENGIYYIADASTDIDPNGYITKLTRALDFNTSTEMAGGDFIFVQSGSQYANTGWVMTETVATVGITPVKFVQFSGAGTYSAGDALNLSGTEFSVRVDTTTIVVNSNNDLEVAPSVMSDLAGKVNKAGDTMTGALTIDQSAGVTTVIQANDILMSDALGEIITQVTHGDGLSASYTDGVSIAQSGTYSQGFLEVVSTSLDQSTEDGQLTVDATQGIIYSKTDYVNQFVATASINPSALVLDFNDQTSGWTSNTSYQHNVVNVQVSDGSGIATFNATAGSPVSNIGFDGLAPTPTLDAHLTSKKYVDDSIAAHVEDASDAHDASAISLTPAINGQSDVQSALADHESRIDTLEGALAPTWGRIKFNLTATDISNGYVDLPHEAIANSIHAFVDRLAIHQDEDFLLSLEGGVTRITFAGDLVAPSESQLDDSDNIYVRYQYLA